MTNDLINACFEFAGAAFILNNCRALYKHKTVRGVSVLSTAFFTAWGFWNVFYYPALNQHISFVAGILTASSNALWIAMMMYYKSRERREVEA